jgi:predicted DNA-binding ribbon-helix-helix protein
MTADDRSKNGSDQHAHMNQHAHTNKTGSDREETRGQSPANGGYLRSRVLKRSIVVGRHRTSISLEDVFWNELREIAHRRGVHLSELVGHIDGERQHCNLSSAIRMFVFEHARAGAETAQNTKGTPDPVVRDSVGTILNRNR